MHHGHLQTFLDLPFGVRFMDDVWGAEKQQHTNWKMLVDTYVSPKTSDCALDDSLFPQSASS